MLAGRSYTPPEAPLRRWRNMLAPLGVTHGVVVQPSFYGTDNRALLAALAESDNHVVGVAGADETISENALDQLAQAGVRGLRFAHFAAGDQRTLGGFVPLTTLSALAPRLRARQMHADVLTDSRLLPDLADMLRAAAVPIVLDHMGRAPAHLGVDHIGITTMLGLAQEGWLWVKLSGVANISDQAPEYGDARAVHELLVRHCPERLVWGSDWPHTKPKAAAPATAQLFRQFVAWTPDPALGRQILWQNARELYRFNR